MALVTKTEPDELRLVLDTLVNLYKLWDEYDHVTPSNLQMRSDLHRRSAVLWSRIYETTPPPLHEMIAQHNQCYATR